MRWVLASAQREMAIVGTESGSSKILIYPPPSSVTSLQRIKVPGRGGFRVLYSGILLVPLGNIAFAMTEV